MAGHRKPGKSVASGTVYAQESQDDAGKQMSTTRSVVPPQSLRLDFSIDGCVLVFRTHILLLLIIRGCLNFK